MPTAAEHGVDKRRASHHPADDVATTDGSARRSAHPNERTYACWMYPPPTGPDLTAEQRQELDDTFLSSDPYGYFSVRIGMVLWWADSGDASHERPVAPTDDEQHAAGTGGRFARLLGRPVGFVPETSRRSIATQVATDAYALRHHAAESLVRFDGGPLDTEEGCRVVRLGGAVDRAQST